MRARIFIIMVSLILLSSPGDVGAASPKKGKKAPPKSVESVLTFEEQLAGLRKRDPEVRDLGDWTRLVEKAESAGTPEALLVAGHASKQIYEKRQSRIALDRALASFERVPRKHPKSPLADEALLALGDLRRAGLDDDSGARAAYLEILDRYPASDTADTARERIGMKKRSAQNPESKVAERKQPEPEKKSEAAPSKEAKEAKEEKHTPSPYFKDVEGKTVYSREIPRKRPLVVIDPGHGGEDLGAKGVDDVLEKDVVLAVSLMVDELFRERLRARTVLTRASDRAVPLAERTRVANDNQADLFLSIHANASEYKTGSGVETYYLDNTKDKSSLKLAERENASLSFEGGGANQDVSFMLSDLIQNAKLEDSISLAHHLQKRIIFTLGRYYEGVNDLGVKKAPFYVLVGAHMPCVLAEISFIDHPVEGRRLGEKRYQRLLAQAIFEGAREFFQKRQS